MNNINWMQLIMGIAVIALIFPSMMYIFRQKDALRNAVIWLGVLAALSWGYYIIVEKPQLAAMPEPSAPSMPHQTAPTESDSPVRNL